MMENFYSKEFTNLVYFTVGRLNKDLSTAQDLVQQAFLDAYDKIEWATRTDEEIKNYMMGRIRFYATNPRSIKKATGMDYRTNRDYSTDMLLNDDADELLLHADDSCVSAEVSVVIDEVKKSLTGIALDMFNMLVDEAKIPFELFDEVLQNAKGKCTVKKHAICKALNIDKGEYYYNLTKIQECVAANI